MDNTKCKLCGNKLELHHNSEGKLANKCPFCNNRQKRTATVEEKKFYQLYSEEKLTGEEITKYVEEWHMGDSTEELHEFLGMPENLYNIWLRFQVIVKPDMKFYQLYKEGKLPEEAANEFIEQWHLQKGEEELREFLGMDTMPDDAYSDWVTRGILK